MRKILISALSFLLLAAPLWAGPGSVKTRKQLHSFDIIYGPIANDDIGMQMRRIDADLITWEQFVKELEHKGGETFQYFFGTEKSLKYLKKL